MMRPPGAHAGVFRGAP